MPNDEEIRQNLFDVKNAIAQQRLEGLMPSREVFSDLERAAYGEHSVMMPSPILARGTKDAEIRGQRPSP